MPLLPPTPSRWHWDRDWKLKATFFVFALIYIVPIITIGVRLLAPPACKCQIGVKLLVLASDNHLTWVLYFMLLAIHHIELSTAYINAILTRLFLTQMGSVRKCPIPIALL